MLVINIQAQNSLFEEQVVNTDLVGICAIDYADFDQDGDMDIGWGSEWTPSANPTGIHWLENTGDDFTQWVSHSIDPSIIGVMSLQVVDLNNDDLPDLLASAWGSHNVVWYENLGGANVGWTKHTLLSGFTTAHDAYADYINNDNLIDIVAVAANPGVVRIMYNTGTPASPTFDSYDLCNDFTGVRTSISFDFDSDGDKDILAGSTDMGKFYWWRNDGGDEAWTRFLIDDNIDGYHNFSLVDFDFDGDKDFVAIGGNILALYRNEGGNPIAWVRETLDADLGISSRILAADFDLDADIDVFSVSKIPGKLDLFFNNGGIPVNWDKINLNNSFTGAWGCQAIDFNLDGDLDVFACAGADNKLVYLENQTFTDSMHVPKALFNPNKHKACVGSEVEFINLSVGNIDEYNWSFGEGANPATATGTGPHQVTYSTQGSKIITLSVSGTYGSSEYTDTITASNSLNFSLIPDAPIIECRGDSVQLAVYGADSYIWNPEPVYLNGNNSVVKIGDIDTSTYTISGTMGNCTSDTIVTVVVAKKENDDICGAIMLNIGFNSGFSNECTMPEAGEPVPPLTGCETQLSWCDDGGIQNSIWFTFEAPASGAVSITTFGIDNQIAVYDAETCDDLLLGNYSLLAANDNNGGIFAKIDNLQGLVPGKIYWLQLDGYEGAEGNNSITIAELSTTNHIKTDNQYRIFPNPTKGTFQLHSYESNKSVNLQIFNTIGKTVLKKQVTTKTNINIENLLPGIYNIQLTDLQGNSSMHKIVKY